VIVAPEKWQWKVSQFEAEQVHSGRELPAGCVKANGAFDQSIVGYVSAIDGMSLPIRDKDWLVYDADGVRIRRVLSDRRFRELAVRMEGCGS
jgi:hypothetical protein